MPSLPEDLAARLADPAVLLALVVVFIGGMVRGFSGFGTGMIYMPVAATLFGPQLAAATLLLYDLPAVIPQAIRLLPHARFREILPLSVGATLATPLGVLALATVDPVIVRWTISVAVLAGLALIASGWRRRASEAGTAATLAVGASSGFLSGLAMIGGPPVILFWLSAATSAVSIRASLVLYFLIGSAVTIVSFAVAGLVTREAIVLAILMAPVFGVGLLIGHHAFDIASERTWRRIAYSVILASALVGLPIWR